MMFPLNTFLKQIKVGRNFESRFQLNARASNNPLMRIQLFCSASYISNNNVKEDAFLIC